MEERGVEIQREGLQGMIQIGQAEDGSMTLTGWLGYTEVYTIEGVDEPLRREVRVSLSELVSAMTPTQLATLQKAIKALVERANAQ